MTDKADHGLVVKAHWKSGAQFLRQQLQNAPAEAEKEPLESRSAYLSGIYSYVAGAALDLVDQILEAAEAAEGALPIRLTLGHHLIIDGQRFKVVNAWQETEATDGRTRWGIVTEGEEQPAAPADATAAERP